MTIRNTLDDLHDYSIDIPNRELYITRAPRNEDDSDVESRMAANFIKNLRILDKKPGPILIHLLGGGGGGWEDGMAMYDAISFCESYISILMYGHACSMSSLIPQAADFRVIMPNCYMMCHYGYETLDDVHMNVRLWTSFSSSTLSKKLIDIYAGKMQHSPYIKDRNVRNPLESSKRFLTKKLKDGDWYMTPEDILYYGFADSILGESKTPTINSLKDM